ncbi:MAG: matrixin family metalloprotease [Minisyncoccota bacterium]
MTAIRSLYRVLAPVVLTVLIAGTAYTVYHANNPAPCSTPIEYSLGSFDPRFGESRANFLVAVASAAKLWDTAAGRELFAYTPNGTLKINLIYDFRQAATNLGQKISAEQTAYDAQKRALDALKTQYESDKQQYETQVAYWNARGGAPPSAYASLESMRQKLNSEASTINTDTAALNALAAQTNAKVGAYNTAAGTDFNEGEYIRDSSGSRINVYQFENQDKLVRVLAHELGHALGLAHNTDPNAIMYAYNQGTAEKLTAADVSELKALCHL